MVRILPEERQAAIAVAATLSPERAGSIELPANAREVILIPDDLTGETAWAALKRRCEEKDTTFSVSRWFPDSASVYDVLLLDGPEALTQTLGAALSSPLLHKTCERLRHDWRRHIETAQAGGALITQAPGYEGLTARLQSMTDALAPQAESRPTPGSGSPVDANSCTSAWAKWGRSWHVVGSKACASRTPVCASHRTMPGSVANLTKGRGAPGRKTCSTYVSALARRSCSNVMASVRTHGPTPKARSMILASPTMPPWMANIRAWPLRSARITSKPLIVA